ncbi:hypothetical protein CYMTET_47164 [Cymbomonas tetramitiformis]|uniref:Uncharacterized protein n=1 Tax=Cymbomonas tetramitiformis TaxID=36881 RepID=A0AAE0EXZ7_9CHLO|nr:hypothetical protein CYMTET_47164 [Cymbomonas tetramitiformis]
MRSYVDNEEEDKAMRKAEKMVKAEKQAAAAAARQCDQPRGNPTGERVPLEQAPSTANHVPSPPMPQGSVGLQLLELPRQYGHHQNDCTLPRQNGAGRGRGRFLLCGHKFLLPRTSASVFAMNSGLSGMPDVEVD